MQRRRQPCTGQTVAVDRLRISWTRSAASGSPPPTNEDGIDQRENSIIYADASAVPTAATRLQPSSIYRR